MAAVSIPQTSSVSCEANVQQEFDALVQQWHEETDVFSSLPAKFAHPAYGRIIAIGFLAVPLLVRELKHRPGFWFQALTSLTHQNPVPPGSNFEQARQAWLEWGQQQGYIE